MAITRLRRRPDRWTKAKERFSTLNGLDPLRIDPTRTGPLRSKMEKEIKARFARLRRSVADLVVKEDAFGLKVVEHLAANESTPQAIHPSSLVDNCGGVGSGVPGPCPSGVDGATLDAAASKTKTILGRLGGVPGRVVSWVKGSMTKKYENMKERYGDKYAKAIIATMIVGLPLPGGTVLPLPLVAIAEAHRYFVGKKTLPLAPAVANVLHSYDHLGANETASTVVTPRKPGADGAPAQGNGAVGSTKKADRAAKVVLTVEEVNKAALDLAREIFKELGWPAPSKLVLPTPDPTKQAEKPTKPVANSRFRFNTDAEKVKAFQSWLKAQVQSTLTGKSEEAMWKRYAEEGLRKGAGRAFEDTTRAERALGDALDSAASSGGSAAREVADASAKLDFYRGSKDAFLRSSFAQPVAVDKIKLLAGRSFDEMEGVTGEMSLKMSRALTDGLVEGKSPREVARDLNDVVDLAEGRTLVIARTEIIRAHAEGQLMAMDELGVEEVGVAVEWATAGDDRVCDLCAPLEGVVLKIDEARGMLPRHPNCRCAWLPANVGESDEERKTSKAQIERAVRASQSAGADAREWGPDEPISKSRPESIVNTRDRLASALDDFSTALHLLVNCGGPGSGVPGPCPKGYGPERDASLKLAKQRFASMIKANQTLTGEQRQAYYAAASKTFERMPQAALDSFNANVVSTEFYRSPDELTQGVRDAYASQGRTVNLPAGQAIAGAYNKGEKLLRLDGDAGGHNTQGVYGHEFTHALDGPHYEISRSPAWKEAFNSEIKSGRLSAYATHNEQEGLAEFGRLVYGSGYDKGRIASQFPKCAAVLQERGLY